MPERRSLVAAFTAIYLIWGSTYLAIRFALEAFPPFIMAGLRFLAAGLVMYLWARLQGAARPRPVHWRSAAILGLLFFFFGNGGVVWAEQRVPSGLTAVLVAVVPVWTVFLEWIRPGASRPSPGTWLGMALGFAGVVWLMVPTRGTDAGGVDPAGASVLMLASLLWACGTIYSRGAPLPPSTRLVSGMEMLCGSGFLLAASVVAGEWQAFQPGAVTLKPGLAIAYLLVFGSLIGFTAFAWLTRATTPVKVSTYAFVNPMVAVILGWALGGERLTSRGLVASLLIVGAVIMIILGRSAAGTTVPRRREPGESPPITDELPVAG